jgi:predicted nucleotidyltransferase
MSRPTNIEIRMDKVEALCQKWRVRELALFGSVLRDDFGPDSDIDVLVSFEDDAPGSLWELTNIQDEISALPGGRLISSNAKDCATLSVASASSA